MYALGIISKKSFFFLFLFCVYIILSIILGVPFFFSMQTNLLHNGNFTKLFMKFPSNETIKLSIHGNLNIIPYFVSYMTLNAKDNLRKFL